jgi:hypothetical protein
MATVDVRLFFAGMSWMYGEGQQGAEGDLGDMGAYRCTKKKGEQPLHKAKTKKGSVPPHGIV